MWTLFIWRKCNKNHNDCICWRWCEMRTIKKHVHSLEKRIDKVMCGVEPKFLVSFLVCSTHIFSKFLVRTTNYSYNLISATHTHTGGSGSLFSALHPTQCITSLHNFCNNSFMNEIQLKSYQVSVIYHTSKCSYSFSPR